MIQVVVPADKREFIQTTKGRAIVARYRQTSKRRFEIQYAANWEALESEAAEAVEEQGGSVADEGHYPCPPELAAQAIWPA